MSKLTQHTANRFSSLAADKTEDFMVFQAAQNVFFYDFMLQIFAAMKWQYLYQSGTVSFVASVTGGGILVSLLFTGWA